jgi:hypothetical protein
MSLIYGMLVEKGYSFVVRDITDTDKRIVAVALNFDLYDEPNKIRAPKGIQTVMDFLEYVEGKQR